jgi:hypothetical protein
MEHDRHHHMVAGYRVYAHFDIPYSINEFFTCGLGHIRSSCIEIMAKTHEIKDFDSHGLVNYVLMRWVSLDSTAPGSKKGWPPDLGSVVMLEREHLVDAPASNSNSDLIAFVKCCP